MGDGQSRASGLTSGPVVCVLLCTHDDAPTLDQAIASVRAQTLARERYELLVVDDASEDSSPSIVSRHATAEPRIRVHRTERNLGLVRACNRGLELIDAPFFVRLDGDDRFEPGLLEALMEAAGRSGADVASCDRYDEDPSGRRVLRQVDAPADLSGLIAVGTLLPTAMVRDIGGYRDLFWEEYDLYLRLLDAGGRWTHVPEPLVVYHVGDEGRMTSDPAAVAQGWRELAESWPGEMLARHGLAPDRPPA